MWPFKDKPVVVQMPARLSQDQNVIVVTTLMRPNKKGHVVCYKWHRKYNSDFGEACAMDSAVAHFAYPGRGQSSLVRVTDERIVPTADIESVTIRPFKTRGK